MRRKKFRKGRKFGKGSDENLQVVVLPGSDINNLCKKYQTKTILHGNDDYKDFRLRLGF